MTTIPDAERSRLTARIHARLAVLRNELKAGLHQSPSADIRGLANRLEETGEAALANLDTATELAELQRDIGEFNALRGALQRLHKGTYGTCETCGVEIPLARLCISPEAARCVECQFALEAQRGVSPSSL
jgi:DnaK suppressor protein